LTPCIHFWSGQDRRNSSRPAPIAIQAMVVNVAV
jgi:hypothetical protein